MTSLVTSWFHCQSPTSLLFDLRNGFSPRRLLRVRARIISFGSKAGSFSGFYRLGQPHICRPIAYTIRDEPKLVYQQPVDIRVLNIHKRISNDNRKEAKQPVKKPSTGNLRPYPKGGEEALCLYCSLKKNNQRDYSLPNLFAKFCKLSVG